MEKIQLSNGEKIEIKNGSSLSSIQVEVANLDEFKALCEKFTDKNLSEVIFLNEAENECSRYTDKTIANSGYSPNEDEETGEIKLIATLSLKDVDQVAKALKELKQKLEETQTTTEVLTGAIADIATLVGGE
jgi:antitoxin component of MazEF toxin-antitoxin module